MPPVLTSIQQSSLRGIRTALIFQLSIAWIAWSSVGPSKMPQFWMQAYSPDVRLTPRRRTGWPAALRIWLPEERSPVMAGAREGESDAQDAHAVCGCGVTHECRTHS